MNLTIHQITAGEAGKAWALLKTSMLDTEIARKIAFQLDFHDSLPTHIELTSAIRGFSYEEYFLLMRTFADDSPDVRRGRAYSHCLILGLAEICKVDNIEPLLDLLYDSIDKTSDLPPITLNLTGGVASPISENLKQRFNCVIRGISNSPTNSKTFIWVGQQHFERAVVRLWEILTPSQRENLNFGVNFNPRKIIERSLKFIAVPEGLEATFGGHSFDVIRKNDTYSLTEISELFIAGEPKAMERIEAFRSAMDALPFQRSAMPLVVKGIPAYENLAALTDLRQIVTLSNIVVKFAPIGETGKNLKAQILQKIKLPPEGRLINEILTLRNFPQEGFSDWLPTLRGTLQGWIEYHLWDINAVDLICEFIQKAYETPSDLWFFETFEQSLLEKFTILTTNDAKVLWNCIVFAPGILHLCGTSLLKAPQVEDLLCNSFTSLSEANRTPVMQALLELRWLSLYAHLLRDYLPIRDAAKALLEVDKEMSDFSRLEIILRDATAADKISVACRSGDIRCLSIASTSVLAQPELISDLDVSDPHCLEIWQLALTSGLSASEGIVNFKAKVDVLFETLIAGGPCNEELLLHVGRSALGDLTFHTQRELLWQTFPPTSQLAFLETTSKALLEGVSNGSISAVPTDSVLKEYIANKGITDFLYYNRGDLSKTIILFQSLDSIPEHMIKDYIKNYAYSLNKWTAIQLGSLVGSRNYRTVASAILYKAPFHTTFIPAVEQCLSLYLGWEKLGALTLCGITDAQMSSQEWWQIFLEVACKLYPGGPINQKVWMRAGGEESDLLVNSTGREIWDAALQKLHHKACSGDIERKHLLRVMMEDFKNNSELKTLKDLWRKWS